MKQVVIKRYGEHLGLFSYVITNVGAINKVVNDGNIPVIDMMTYKNQYLNDNQVGHINAWELYFEQPCGVGMNGLKDNFVVFDKVVRNRPSDSMRFFLNKRINNHWKEISSKYLRIKPEVYKIIEKYKKKYIKPNDRVLGVLCRGTDYTSLKPFRHPRQPEITQLFDKIDDVLKKYNYNKIFIATEDINILNAFKNKYKNMLVYHDQVRYDLKTKDYLCNVDNYTDQYKKGLDYLISIVILSKCNAFVGGVTSGTVGVQLFNPHFEYEYYFNLGRYGMPQFIKYYYNQK